MKQVCNQCQDELQPSEDILDALFWTACLTPETATRVASALDGIVKIHITSAGHYLEWLRDIPEHHQEDIKRLASFAHIMRTEKTQPRNLFFIDQLCERVQHLR